MNSSALFAQFQRRLSAAGGVAQWAEDLAQAAGIIATHPALAEQRLIIPPAFASCQPWGAILPLLRRHGLHLEEAATPEQVADAPAGLSSAVLAIAETGSVVLADNSLAARIVGMLTLTHFVLVSAEQLVPLLDEAATLLQTLTRPGPQQQHYISLVTGPSRTADIERTLTIGVQGPRALHVIVVATPSTGDLSSAS
ncbi:LutC/YkgG family protein [Thermogemmatispora sp.]|uniref:LutC/YkgG family protein n=1 Tax=Thermogemmatispora sp. TaxID=1968838 RepID=UPI001E0C56AF|nr:lactate utilization protein [Thermogemmatispora sp.]MBX5451299.1 lactate utilization protein [Thermogemmatispora sp.]